MADNFNIQAIVSQMRKNYGKLDPQQQAGSLFNRPTAFPEIDESFIPQAIIPKVKPKTYPEAQTFGLGPDYFKQPEQTIDYTRPPLKEYKPQSFLETAANAIIPSVEAVELPNDSWYEALLDKQIYDRGNTVIPSLNGFENVMPSIYKWEGNYQQMKNDSGNYTSSGKLIGTNKGISAKTLESYLGREPTVDEMKNLDQETISNIYRDEFYNRYKINKLPVELQKVAMHGLVTGGPKTIKYLQELAGTDQDMIIGEKTIKALKDKGITAEQLKNKILSKYETFNSWNDFGKGWTNRFNDLI